MKRIALGSLLYVSLNYSHVFDDIRLASHKPWVKHFNELRSWSNNQDEFAIRALKKLKKSLDDPEYIIKNANVIDLLAIENKALISKDTKKIIPEVKEEIQKAMQK